jgi:siroheme synthase (precorrin-2 oxidase/ferrochelatase)
VPKPPFFPVSLDLTGRRCVVIGPRGDREAIEKAAAFEESGAELVWITDALRLQEADVAGAFLVVSTPQDAALSERLSAWARTHRFLLCCIDQPAFGSVAMVSIAKAGPVRISISTSGVAPRVAKILKESLQRALDTRFVTFVEAMARKREEVRREHPGPGKFRVRRAEILAATDGFAADVRFSYPAHFETDAQA